MPLEVFFCTASTSAHVGDQIDGVKGGDEESKSDQIPEKERSLPLDNVHVALLLCGTQQSHSCLVSRDDLSVSREHTVCVAF